jgi:phage-related baseplate assembly protein
MTGRTLYPADPTRLFILWIADIIVQEREIINESAKQNVPRYADGDYLDSLAELFKDTERLQAQAARTTLRFYISEAQTSVLVIPAGARATVDGEIIFATTENLSIEPGELYGDAPAVCVSTVKDPSTGQDATIGEKGNGFLPGQISQIINPFPYFDRVENITISDGGAAREEDDAFYNRMRESMETFSTAGPTGAYIYHARTASARIVDVAALSPEAGIIDIRILLNNGELPDEEMIQLVQESLSADKTRPLTDFVSVSAPDTVTFDIDVIYYIPRYSASSEIVIKKDAENAVRSYIKWQTEKMGRDINPSYLTSLLMDTGVKRVVITNPGYSAVRANAVAVLGNQNVVYGGLENE